MRKVVVMVVLLLLLLLLLLLCCCCAAAAVVVVLLLLLLLLLCCCCCAAAAAAVVIVVVVGGGGGGWLVGFLYFFLQCEIQSVFILKVYIMTISYTKIRSKFSSSVHSKYPTNFFFTHLNFVTSYEAAFSYEVGGSPTNFTVWATNTVT
jgi:uncharacterized SAM-binding protein YcdF (DUF218 family)